MSVETQCAAAGGRWDAVDLGEWLREIVRSTKISGIAVEVRAGGERIASSVGEFDGAEEPSFELGCVSRLLQSLALFELSEARQIELDAPARRYLTQIENSERASALSVRHLLSHTCGYRGLSFRSKETSLDHWSSSASFLESTPLLFDPGTVFNYELLGGLFADGVLANVTDRSADEIIAEKIARHVRLLDGAADARAFRHQLDRTFHPMRSGRIRLFDLASVGEAVIESDLGMRFRSEMARSRVELPFMFGGESRRSVPSAYGLGCAEYSDGWLGHAGTGSTQCCAVRFHPEHRLVVAVGVNAAAPMIREMILLSVVDFAEKCCGIRARTNTKAPVEFGLKEVLGSYIGGVTELSANVSEAENGVVCKAYDRVSNSVVSIPMKRETQGYFAPTAENSPSVGFFRYNGVPCLMIGITTFKHIA